MKKKFTFLMAALMLLTMMVLPGKAVGQSKSSAGFNLTSKPTDGTTGTITGTASETWSWTATFSGTTYYGWTNSAWQVGANNKACTRLVFEATISGATISQIDVSCGTQSGKGTVNCTVGGSNFGTQGQSAGTGNNPNSYGTTPSFTGSANGKISVTINNTGTYISVKSITVTYSTGSTHTVTYNAGDGSGTVPTGNSYAPGVTVTVANRGGVTHETKGFRGWTDGVNIYDPGETFEMGSSDVTLTAVWTDKCTFAYNGNGNTGGAIPTGYYESYGTGAKVVVVGNTGDLVKNSAVWDGWNTANDGTGTTYQEDDSFTITSNTTLYAKWRNLATYTLVTNDNGIKPGKHYIFVAIYTNGGDDYYYAMGKDRGNNRLGVSVIYDDVNEKIIEAEGLYEFIISGSNDDGCYYTIYDENTLGLNENDTYGYLYAPGVGTSGNNFLRTRTSNSTNEGQGQWTITIADGNLASIVANVSTDNARIYMKYNHNSGNPDMFSCYGTSGANIYIYEKDDDNDCHIYSATNINKDMTVTGSMNIHSGVVTVAANKTLTVNGTLTNTTASNLVINNGAQLYTSSNNVNATIKKAIAAAENNSDENWYLISSPVGTVNTDVVTTGHTCNLYAYNEKDLKWNGYAGSNGFSSLASGNGYLYRKNDAEAISFAGTVTTGALSPIALSYERDDAFAGFNLLGNPYSHNLQSNCISLTNGATFSGVYTLGVDGNWYSSVLTDIKPCEGFLVQVDQETSATFSELAKGATYNNDYIQFNVANSQYEDVAYALFNDSKGLTKINHRNADIPMLYINKKGIDYAIATMSDDTKSFDLSFKAMTTGKYTLSYKANGKFSYLHIIDRLTGADVDMLLEGEYSFIATPTDQNDRFIVKLGYSPEYGYASNDIFAFQSGNEVFVSGSGELQIFDVTGRKVMTTTINGAESISVTAPGIYIFRLVGTEVKTQKIVVR